MSSTANVKNPAMMEDIGDLKDLLESIQGNQLLSQRSSIKPHTASATVNPSSEETVVPPVEESCDFYSETLPCKLFPPALTSPRFGSWSLQC